MAGFKFGDTLNDTIQDITKKITNISFKDYSDALKPTSEEFMTAARNTLIKKEDVMNYVKKSDVESRINESLQAIQGDKAYLRDADKLLKSVDAKDFERVNEIANDISKKHQDDRFVTLLQEAEGKKTDSINSINNSKYPKERYKDSVKIPEKLNNYIPPDQQEGIKKLAYGANGMKQYFNSGDAATNQKRIGAVGIGYMGAATGTRLLRGGGLTKNEYGERDIVGLPFV